MWLVRQAQQRRPGRGRGGCDTLVVVEPIEGIAGGLVGGVACQGQSQPAVRLEPATQPLGQFRRWCSSSPGIG